MHCPKCRSSEVEWVEIKETGELVAFTTVMYGPAGFENHVPYTLAAVKFPNGLRIFGEIDAKMPNEQIMEGMKLRVVPVKLSENRVSYQFQKA
jgi:uncharacterized OB-fold protein